MSDLSGLSPAELRPGEDPVRRFRDELHAVQADFLSCSPRDLAATLAEAIRSSGAGRVALTGDLGQARPALVAALQDVGIDTGDYESIATSREALAALDATVTGCLAAVAATGSILTGGLAGRAGALIAPMHVCVVERGRLLNGLRDVLRTAAGSTASALALQSGPSRTADIEKTLILGMHGPRHTVVVLLDGSLDHVPVSG